jgi:predicted SAM-dependent methyltransferase
MRLHLGCNDRHIDGFLNVDLLPGPGVDIVSSAHELLDIEDDSVNEILAEHLLEHFTFFQANRAIAEWYRVLKPDGKITIEVPDLMGLCEAFVKATDYQRFQSNKGHWGLIHHFFGNQRGRSEEENLAQTHKSGYTVHRLYEMLLGVGFKAVAEVEPVKNTPGSSVIRMVATK